MKPETKTETGVKHTPGDWTELLAALIEIRDMKRINADASLDLQICQDFARQVVAEVQGGAS